MTSQNRSSAPTSRTVEHRPRRSAYFQGEFYQRRSDDLQLVGMSQWAHDGSLRVVRQLADFCKRPPKKITED